MLRTLYVTDTGPAARVDLSFGERLNQSVTTVRAHQVVNPWNELTVNWPNFGSTSNFDPTAIASFTTGNDGGPRTFDITALAVDWVSGNADNNGILLEEDLAGTPTLHAYAASEWSTAAHRPKLDVCYTPPEDPACGGGAQCVAENGACEGAGECCNGLPCLFGTCVGACVPTGGTCEVGGPSTCCPGAPCAFSFTPCETGNGNGFNYCPVDSPPIIIYQCCGAPGIPDNFGCAAPI